MFDVLQAVSAKVDASSHRSDSTEAKILRVEAMKTLEQADEKLKKYKEKTEDDVLTLRKEYESKVSGPDDLDSKGRTCIVLRICNVLVLLIANVFCSLFLDIIFTNGVEEGAPVIHRLPC